MSELILILILVEVFLHAIVFHTQTRNKIGSRCVKENHLKTFTDKVVDNIIIATPHVFLFLVMTIIVDVVL